MQTITDKLQILKDNTESIRRALSGKVGYDVGPMLKDYSEIISSITGGILGESDVNFYDYDGALLHSYTKDLDEKIKTADIVISAVGKKIVRCKMVKKNSVVIDVGIFKDNNGQLTGDVDFDVVKDIAGHITPVPGGCGPMTIAMLLQNTLKAAKLQTK